MKRLILTGWTLLGVLITSTPDTWVHGSHSLFEASFEAYVPGSSLQGQDGWNANIAAHAIIVADPDETTGQEAWSSRTGSRYPLHEATRDQVLEFQDASWKADRPFEETDLWFDLLVKPGLWQEPQAPPISEDDLCAFYADDDGRLMAAVSTSFDASSENQWIELTGVDLDPSGWTRLSVNLRQGPDTAFFSVHVDGQGAVSNASGYLRPDETAATGGSWFPCPNLRSRLAPNALALRGQGRLDDVVMTGNRPQFQIESPALAIISIVHNPHHGHVQPGDIIQATSGTDLSFFVYAEPYFHLDAVLTNNIIFAGYILDFAHTNQYAFDWHAVPPGEHTLEVLFAPDRTSVGTPIWWIAQHFQTNDYEAAALLDWDGDGMPVWAEYLAGTDPTDPESTFRVIDIGQRHGSNYVAWIGGGDPHLPPFTVYRSTNLVDGVWQPVGFHQRQAGAISNLWFDPVSPPGAFYRIGVSD